MNLDKDKLVIEELSRMKSLFGYERGRVISEQNRGSGASALGDGIPKVTTEKGAVSQTRQEVINSIFCGVDANGKLTAPGWQGKTFDEYSQGLTQPVTASELATAKASCTAAKDAANNAKDAEWDAKTSQERVTGVFCSVNSDEIIKVDRPRWNGTAWPDYLAKATPRPTAQEIAAAKASCPTAWLSTQDIYKQTKTTQERINGVYCSVRNGIITIERPEWKGKTWEQYVTDTKTTEDKIAIAKKSCNKAYSLFPAPKELKSKQGGVKEFQDWLVANKLGNELGRFGADGKFGKFTKAAWEKHKDEYLKQPTAVNTGYEEYGGVSGNVQSSGNVGQAPTGNVGQAPTGNVGQAPTGNQSNLEQMPMRDADYFNGYQ